MSSKAEQHRQHRTSQKNDSDGRRAPIEFVLIITLVVIFIDINEGSILTGLMLCVKILMPCKTVSTMLEIRNEDECVGLALNGGLFLC